MKKGISHSVYTIILILIFPCLSLTQIRVGLIAGVQDHEIEAAWDFINSDQTIQGTMFDLTKLTGPGDLNEYDVVWYHATDRSALPEDPAIPELLRQYSENGGSLLLSLEAAWWLKALGLEEMPPAIRDKKLEDTGYGRMAGLHAFRSHPVFDGLNGGSYILKPLNDTLVTQCGYFSDTVPNGKVVAVDWDYIFVREQKKLMLEYETGAGSVMAVGGYMAFSSPNINRQHLEKFTLNLLRYLSGQSNEKQSHYWTYGEQTVVGIQSLYPALTARQAEQWVFPEKDPWTMVEPAGDDNYWDVAGERTLIMGNERGGIDEIWMHPFMAFRDIETGLFFPDSDSVVWLRSKTPAVEIAPGYFKRAYHFKDAEISETIICDKIGSTTVIHYEYNGAGPARIFVKFTSNLRLMWPYSSNVLRTLKYTFDKNLNGYLISDETGDFVSMIGSGKRPEEHFAGRFDRIGIVPHLSAGNREYSFLYSGQETGLFQLTGCLEFRLDTPGQLDIVMAGSNQGSGPAIKDYGFGLLNAKTLFEESRGASEKFDSAFLSIASPDRDFNMGFRWATIATDRFHVHTPGLGKSLVAGYATTDWGWDGEHEISGRPGYSWYFGRDGQWSGFAVLHYGDFRKVREMLEFFQKLQDLNGKIFHEVSTSGFVHYDASDATPLYIVLAGRYLKHSGDSAFISESWHHIAKALDYCFSTDTDGDHLIENTNVGHGWVEGGALFGSHTSLYLASCWAAALEEASYMAGHLGFREKAENLRNKSETVRNIIVREFWNAEQDFFYHGMFSSGEYLEEPSIMPAIPMLFRQVKEGQAATILDDFAGYDFTSDWGCRIVKQSSDLFHPRGYHTGSVWPLFTGWTSLAEYSYGNDVQGFSHIMNNLLVYRNWGKGFVEEVLHGKEYKPSGVCRHQCWSETMVLQPAIEGMLGLKPDAPANRIEISPAFPADWDSVEVKNIRMGEHFIDMKMLRGNDRTTYTFVHKGPQPLELRFTPFLPPGTKVNDYRIPAAREIDAGALIGRHKLMIEDTARISYDHSGGISVLPLVPLPEPGDTTMRCRIIDHSFGGKIYSVKVQGICGIRDTIWVFTREEVLNVENAKLTGREGDVVSLELLFDDCRNDWTEKTVRIHLK